ncbi:uncharacterized protein TNCT_155301 [Trichonephila clavata]|uniref:Ig-like domain-containing protein n=1 Tax=Trichonephila clavata TaxID=2740835 RepID=A0A8X6ILZ9_TRICU|nr:uncharacterized protein TNCT_155301 [Trichonephila clavata]
MRLGEKLGNSSAELLKRPSLFLSVGGKDYYFGGITFRSGYPSVPPVEVQIEEKKRALSAQKPVELVCRAGGSRPPANITWFIGNQPLKGTKEKISSEGNITTGRLIFIPTIEDRGKNISCRAENMLIPGSAITDEWKVDVHCKYTLYKWILSNY